MNPVLETERLTLRFFTFDDTKFILELLNSPGWIEFIGDRNVKNEEDAKNYLQNGPLKSYELNGFGLCLVELKISKTPIGMCGLLKRDALENPDIGFAFLPTFMGQGFAFEIAAATLNFAKEELKLPIVFAITVPNNKKSIQLLERIGFQFRKTFCFPNSNEDLNLYSN